MSKYIKEFDTTAELNTFLDGAENGYYLLRDNSDTGETRMHYLKVVSLPNFCIKALADSTVSFNKTDRNLQYSVNGGGSWEDYTGQTVSLSTGAKMYWRRTVSTIISEWSGQGNFTFTGNVELQGNIHSLLVEDFENMTSLVGWTKIFLNAFVNQSAITKIEKLRLPATTLANECYEYMFHNCTNLTGTAPILPATRLTTYCYLNMFNNTKINKVFSYAEDISANMCLISWLNGVPATGDFYNLGGATYPTGGNGIPSGWTEHTRIDS